MPGKHEPLKAELRNGKIYIGECGELRLCSKLRVDQRLDEDGFLDLLEAGYLAFQGLLCVEDKCGWDAFSIISRLVGDLSLLTVYIDLRRRGKRVIRGPLRDSLLVLGGSRSVEIHVLAEYREVNLSDLIGRLKLSVANNRNPVLAIVDRTGIITYYEARPTYPS